MIRTNAKIYASATLSGPGTYQLMAANLTVTLPTWLQWPELGSIIIKDGTGSNPNCTVLAAGGGTIDGQSSASMTVAYESLTFNPFLHGNTWTLA